MLNPLMFPDPNGFYQTPISPEVVDRLLEARLTQLMGVGFVLIVLVLLVIVGVFWRMQSSQDRRIDQTDRLIEKIGVNNDTLQAQGRTLDQQNATLEGIANLMKENLDTNRRIAETSLRRIAQNEAVSQNITDAREDIARLSREFAEGKATAVQEVLAAFHTAFGRMEQAIQDVRQEAKDSSSTNILRQVEMDRRLTEVLTLVRAGQKATEVTVSHDVSRDIRHDVSGDEHPMPAVEPDTKPEMKAVPPEESKQLPPPPNAPKD